MSPALTRRSLVQAGAAAIGASVAGVSASAEATIAASDPDAGLLDLITRHREAEAAVVRLSEASDVAWRAALDAYPPRPDALLWRPDDFPRTSFGRGLSDREGVEDARWYGPRAMGWLRDRPAETWFATLDPPLGVECEARRLEILAAWDACMAERRAVEDRVGYRALVEAEDAAAGLVVTLAAEIGRARPATLAGLRALAGWVGRQAEAGAAHDDLLSLFARTVASFGVGT